MRCSISIFLVLAAWAAYGWQPYTIDNSLDGADGVRLADINRDGRPDIVTPFEEGGVITCYINSGPNVKTTGWMAQRVGAAPAAEDAVFADLDGDGDFDVVSCSEGSEKTVWIHWAGTTGGAPWTSEALPASQGLQQWMFCLPMDVDGENGIDLVCAGKNERAAIGWFKSPADPRDLAAWTWHPIRPAGWVMSLLAADMNGDGRNDVLFSDRRGEESGVYYLEHPGNDKVLDHWPTHLIGARGEEVMFMDGGAERIVAGIRPKSVALFNREGDDWQRRDVTLPDTVGTAKSVRFADLDLDGSDEILTTCEHAKDLVGVFYIELDRDEPEFVSISGELGTKFDLTAVFDLDDDGDLDVITCEESEGLGVIWYENPSY